MYSHHFETLLYYLTIVRSYFHCFPQIVWKSNVQTIFHKCRPKIIHVLFSQEIDLYLIPSTHTWHILNYNYYYWGGSTHIYIQLFPLRWARFLIVEPIGKCIYRMLKMSGTLDLCVLSTQLLYARLLYYRRHIRLPTSCIIIKCWQNKCEL